MLNNAAALAQHVRTILTNLPQQVPADVKDSFVALSFARALSMHLPMPTSPVESIQAHYSSACQQAADAIIARFNEQYVLDVSMVRDLTFKFYKLRYRLVFEPKSIAHLIGCIARNSDDALPKVILDNENTYGTVESMDAFNMLVWNFGQSLMDGQNSPTQL